MGLRWLKSIWEASCGYKNSWWAVESGQTRLGWNWRPKGGRGHLSPPLSAPPGLHASHKSQIVLHKRKHSLFHVNAVRLPPWHVPLVGKEQQVVRLPGCDQSINKAGRVPEVDILVDKAVDEQELPLHFVQMRHDAGIVVPLWKTSICGTAPPAEMYQTTEAGRSGNAQVEFQKGQNHRMPGFAKALLEHNGFGNAHVAALASDPSEMTISPGMSDFAEVSGCATIALPVCIVQALNTGNVQGVMALKTGSCGCI